MPAVDLEQTRAQLAFGTAVAISDEKKRETFLREAQSLPVMLRTNGLLASLAYLRREDTKNTESGVLLAALTAHLQARHETVFGKVQSIFGNSVDAQNPLAGRELQTLTAEAVVFSGWLKRAAEAVCARGATDDAQAGDGATT